MKKGRQKKSSGRKFVVAISPELHHALKALAQREGRVLLRLVEDKLAELVETPSPR